MPKSRKTKPAGPRDGSPRPSVGRRAVAPAAGESVRRVGRIMYIERKAGSLVGPARIGRVTFSKTGRTLRYRDQTFRSLRGAGFKSNYVCVETGEDWWISGPKRRGGDRMYGSALPVEIDEDVRAEYWREIRRQPERGDETVA
ncbi:MAG: hypothetical protein MUE73_17760 [Planctomycetes bacterium]|nr:hypothetical protein [Planctomycetota bacterium]